MIAPRQWAKSLRGRLDSDLVYAFRHDPLAIAAAMLLVLLAGCALLAPILSSQNPYDLRQLNLNASLLPPAWLAGGDARYLIGTDDQGRDLLSAIAYGMRISLAVGVLSVLASLVLGVGLGLVAGLAGGIVDSFLMRLADVQLSFPAILVALLIDGAFRAGLPGELHTRLAIPILIGAIALSGWVQYARTVRGLTLSERRKEYVQSARVTGVAPIRIALRHILPNVGGPVFVLATVHLATAILTEATLSFLGVGVPPTSPSLGTLVSIGNDFLFSGAWWIAIFPGFTLVLLILAANLLGDWLRDALNPRLR